MGSALDCREPSGNGPRRLDSSGNSGAERDKLTGWLLVCQVGAIAPWPMGIPSVEVERRHQLGVFRAGADRTSQSHLNEDRRWPDGRHFK